MRHDVVIAGAGPVGLMLANELRLAGVRTLVLERLHRPSGQSRALGLHARTVEVLDQRGLLDRFREGSPVWPTAHFAGLRRLDLSALDGNHTYALMVPQARTEEILAERAVELGAELRYGHEIVGFRQEVDGVVVDVRTPEGVHQLRTAYLVGCDGGGSTVRKLGGIDFPGTSSTMNALLGDVRLAEEQPPGPQLRRLAGGLFGVVPLDDGYHRVVAVEFHTPQASRDLPVTLDELRAAVKRVAGVELEMSEPRWTSRFGNATRQAARYRDGRVLLAGDAAHVHFPAGGQGLNTGMQDAVNLGWKLGGVIAGWGTRGLLDSYHAERHPVARQVCHNTRAQLALMDPAEEITPLRELFARLMDFAEVNRYLAGMVTGVDIRYDLGDGHPLVGRRMPDLALRGPEGTSRAVHLLRSGRGVLLDLTGSARLRPAAAGWADRVDVISAECDTEAPAAALLLRPDGYLAWASDDPTAALTDELEVALTRWFGPAGRPVSASPPEPSSHEPASRDRPSPAGLPTDPSPRNKEL
ncbi:FAD-dependent monooxygenase [Micromonospora wenchangensis]|uniref:FAD-dependent monooxygenase n=1 Tax=Micromonospora wenchangensis TaxID=1185415 RepID=UPI003D74AE36